MSQVIRLAHDQRSSYHELDFSQLPSQQQKATLILKPTRNLHDSMHAADDDQPPQVMLLQNNLSADQTPPTSEDMLLKSAAARSVLMLKTQSSDVQSQYGLFSPDLFDLDRQSSSQSNFTNSTRQLS